MLLQKNSLEEEVAKNINFDSELWPSAINRVKALTGDRALGWGHLSGLLAEALVRESVILFCSYLDGRAVLDPIPNEAKSRSYFFTYENGILTVKKKENRQLNSDVDLLLILDGLPVLFEVKTGVYNGGNSSRSRTKSSFGTHFALRKDRIMEVTDPIKQYFQSDCGFVLVVPSDHILPDSEAQRRFTAENGVLADFGVSRDFYQLEMIPNIVSRYGLKTKGEGIRSKH